MMRRSAQHKTILNKICHDDRLSPNRRMLGEMLAIWLDSQDDDIKQERILRLIEAQFGDPRKTFWLEGDDPNRNKTLSEAEKEATDKLKEFFKAAQENDISKLERIEETNEVS
jgi:hypothetical protein